jgi:hypothetical protein
VPDLELAVGLTYKSYDGALVRGGVGNLPCPVSAIGGY